MMINQKSCILDIESEGLDPKAGRIICIGTKSCSNGKSMVFYDEDEQILIENFINYYNKNGFEEVIGYNILFDLRFIFSKCLKYRINASRFFNSKNTDLMVIMKSVGYRYSYNKPGTLDE